ncbi:MAG: murein transglycosylase domain-containing protein, partial [Thiohalomonadales bacterium]
MISMAEIRLNNWGSALSNIRKISVLLFCFSLFFYLPLANAKHKVSHGTSAKKYQSASQKLDKKYNQYKKQVKRAFADYVNKTAKIWGKDTVVPSAAVNVTYHNNFSERSVMDFTKGKVKVELAINKANMRPPPILRSRLSAAVRKAILMGADTRS